MTRAHGGYTSEELQAAVGGEGTEGAAIAGQKTFDELASEQPESAEAYRSVPPSGPGTTQQSPASPPDPEAEQRNAISRKINARMNKAKKLFAEKLPRIAFDKFTEGKGGEWKLDDDESEMISEAVETMFDAMGVEFAIEPMNVVLRSKFWLMLYPVCVFAFIFGLKALKAAKLTVPEEKPEEKPVAE